MGRISLLLLVSLLPLLASGASFPRSLALGHLSALHMPARHISRLTVTRDYTTHYFRQKVDHFGFDINKKFKQRYLIADKHWKKQGGAILFYTGNEGDIIWFCNNTGFMWDVAEEMNAMLVFAEHRYYGESLPFGSRSFQDSRHLNFLTSEQALADFAEIVNYLKHTIPGVKNQPVIAIGGSYGGMLAAWFRMKYPHMIVGALAASAPIMQFENLVPCAMFMEIVTRDFKRSSPHCPENIRRSWGVIDKLGASRSSLYWLSEALHLCSPLTDFHDIQMLKDWISETWVNLAMVNYPYECNFLQPLPAWPVKAVCKHLKDPKVSDQVLMLDLFKALNVYYNHSGQAKCLNISETTTSNLGSLGWSYQACTEIIMPLCTTGVSDMFEPHAWKPKELAEDCFKQWGVTPRPSWISTMYGGRNIKSHKNIVFSNGELDPWSAGGVTQNITDDLVAINIQYGAHHLDLRSSNPLDPQTVRLARSLEIRYMQKWIKDFYANFEKQY
ncbi:lysosomal Pro-X carboxypeptidase [Echinops telfairi]|uniref:Lysosomal Pro-X carboxypeptidase n=1 Tax=Echinops telfairi TaxID=9371 RepID=A0ABM0IVV0_ECHTE|nr:lysosomal Pro-X carboxypeptidase [Echinops telfairi]